MKNVTIDNEQYDMVHLAVATTPSKDVKELRCVNKVLDKLEEKGIAKPDGAGYKLLDEEAAFQFEDAEADIIIKRIEEVLPKLQSWGARKILPVVDQLRTETKE